MPLQCSTSLPRNIATPGVSASHRRVCGFAWTRRHTDEVVEAERPAQASREVPGGVGAGDAATCCVRTWLERGAYMLCSRRECPVSPRRRARPPTEIEACSGLLVSCVCSPRGALSYGWG